MASLCREPCSSLQHLTLQDKFKQSLKAIDLCSSLQALTVGKYFVHNLEGARLPCSLQSLTLGFSFNDRRGVTLLSGQNWTFGNTFNRSLKRVRPPNLQMSFGDSQSLKGTILPSSLRSLTWRFPPHYIGVVTPPVPKPVSGWHLHLSTKA
ncbi:unnamed protein product [Effrenium voratum]|nr:unnamed protein product [Effrenium voratum]